MPALEINGARIHYAAYGRDRGDRAPILLIHGSTVNGELDWSSIAPYLARQYCVYVPDCRGHGKSSNPDTSYSFLEMADDAAALIRALGYARAHVIGHSNGGNVALVTLMEHPEVVQSAVLQAANAYVSRYLIEREPTIFDPDRAARDSPDWIGELIGSLGPQYPSDYWRDLMWLTMKEIISEPNYSPADLARVERPTLVIMGAQDTVNASDEHAQYIAENIPGARLWIPEDTGHNVHHERPEEWLSCVLGFLEGA